MVGSGGYGQHFCYMEPMISKNAGDSQATRLLRHQHTLAYFKDGGWTRDPKEADRFSDVLEAAETCVKHGLVDVDLILQMNGGDSNHFSTPARQER